MWSGRGQAGPLSWDPGVGNAGTGGTALGGNGNWVSDGSLTNWYRSGTGDVVWDSTDAIFGGTPGTVTVAGGGVNASSMRFDSGYTVTGGAVSLTGGANALISNASSAVNSNVNILTTAGTITSNAGTLILGGTLNAGSMALTFAGPGNTTLNNTISNATALTKLGAGILTFNADSSAFVAPINLNAGVVEIMTGKLGGTGLLSLQPGTTVNLTSLTANRLGGRPLTLSGGTLNLSGSASETTGNFTLSIGQSVINNTSNLTLTLGGAAPSRSYGGTALFKGGSTINFGATPAFTGQTGDIGTNNKGLLPWAIFDAGTGLGSSFATTDTTGTTLRALAGNEGTNDLSANTNAMLTSNPAATNTAAVNSITFNSGSNAVAVNPTTLAGVQTLTISSGGILSNVASSGISGGVLSFSNPMTVFTPGANKDANVLTISNTITSTGLVKAGAGTLVLSSTSGAYPGYSANNISNGNGHAGSFFINEGTLQLGASNALSIPTTTPNNNDGPSIQISAGGTLDLNGKTQYVGALMSQYFDNTTHLNNLAGVTGGTVTSTNAGQSGNLILLTGNPGSGGPFTFSGSITGTNVGLARTGQAANNWGQVLAGPNTYGGPTLLNGGGTSTAQGLILKDDGTLSGTSRIDINYVGLVLDNTGLSNNSNRINDAAPIGLNGGYLYFLGRAQTASTETLGPVTAAQGNSTITITPSNTGVNSAELTLTSLSRTAGATLNFVASSGILGQAGSSGNPRVFITNALSGNVTPIGAVNNQIIPGVVIGADLAAYNAATGIGAVGQTNFPAYSVGTLATAAVTANFSGSGNIASGGQTINALKATAAITFPLNTSILTVTSGMIVSAGRVFGTTSVRGGLTSSAPELILQTNGGNATVNSVISGSNKLVLAGGGTYTLTANNLQTGGTTVDGGTLALTNSGLATPLVVSIPNATTPANGLVLNGATANLTNSPGQIGAGNIVTLDGSSTLNLFGNNTLASLALNNIGSSGGISPVVNTTPSTFSASTGSTGITLTLTGGITTTSNQIDGTPTTINGRVSLPAGAALSIGAATFNNQIINPLQADLIVTGLTGGGGTITKSGTGILQFNQPTTITGSLDVTGGGLQVSNVSGAGARLADVTLENGTTLNLNGQDALFGSLAAPGTGLVTNTGALKTLTVGGTNASTLFAGSFRRFNDTAFNLINLTKIGSGTMTLTGNTSTASGILTLNSAAGGGVTFKDAGVNNFVAGTVVVNSGSSLTIDNSGTTNVPNRLAGLSASGNLPLTLNGGNYTYIGAASAASSESNGTSTNGASTLTLGSGESTITANEGLGGTSVLSFGSLTQSPGSTFTFAGTNLGAVSGTDKILLLDQVNGTIYPRGAVGTDFAVYDTTHGVKAYTGYQTASDINVAANYFKVDATTTIRNLTAARAIYALDIIDNNVNIGTNGAILPTAGLTVYDSAVLVNGTGAIISTPVIALSAEGIFRVNSGKDLTVNSRITGTAGLTKTGTGSLTFSKLQEYTGTTTINQGTLTLAGGLGNSPILATVTNGSPNAPTLQMNGGTLDLNGNNQLVGNIQSSNIYTGGTITNTSGTTATLTSYPGSGTFGGNITGNLNFTLVGASANPYTTLQTFKSQQSYTGNTIIRGGELTLQDKGALYAGVGGTPNIQLNFASLMLDNSGLNPATDLSPTRIPTNASINLNQSAIRMTAGASTDNIFHLGTVTADSGLNMIVPAPATDALTLANNSGATQTVTIDNLQNSANGGIVNLYGYSNFSWRYPTSQAQRLFITNVNGSPVTAGAILPAWMGVTTSGGPGNVMGDFATLSSTGYGIVSYGDTAFGGPGYTSTLASGNVSAIGTTNLTAASTTTKALKLTGPLTFSNAANSLNIESGGLFTSSTSIGASTNSGVLTAGGTASTGSTDLVLAYGGSPSFALNSVVKDTKDVIGSGSAKVRLILVNGNGTFTIAGNNTYSGGTVLMTGRESAGGWVLGGSGTIIPAGGLTLYPYFSGNQNALTTTAPGQIDPSNDVTIIGSGMGLNLTAGNTTLSSLIFRNSGGSGTPLVNTTGTLLLTKTTANGYVIDAANDNLAGSPPTIAGMLTIPDGSTINTSGNAPVDLIISASVATSGSNTPLHKTGAGSVMFTGVNTFGNGVNLDAGSIIFGNATYGGIGLGTLTLADGTAIMSDNNRTIGNPVNVPDNASFTFGTLANANVRANASNSLTLTNTVTLGAGAHTINVNGLNMTGTINGKLTGGTNLIKNGPGTLVLGFTPNDYGGSTTVSGGTLKLGIINALPFTTDLTVNAGAAFDLAGVPQTINSLNGTGLVYNRSATSSSVLTINGSTNGVFSGMIVSAIPANLSLIKSGGNTQTLSGINTYTGPTSISGSGQLLLGEGGLMAGTAVSVTAGGTYGMAKTSSGGSVEGGSTLTLANSTTLNLQDSNYNAMTFTGTGTIDTANFKFDLGTVPAQSDQLVFGNVATTSGTSLVYINMLGATLTSSTDYPLIKAVSGLGLANFDLATKTVGPYDLTLTGGGNNISLHVGIRKYYDWTGAADTNWHNVANWHDTIPAANITAMFSDTSVSGPSTTANLGSTDGSVGGLIFNTNKGPVTIQSTGAIPGNLILDNGTSTALVNVTGSGHLITAPVSLPSSLEVTVNPSSDLTINGSISGSKPMTKLGGGILTLGGNNPNFTGGVTIAAGTLRTTNAYALGDPSKILFPPFTAGSVNVQTGGTLQVGVPGLKLANLNVNGTVMATSIAAGGAGSTGDIELGTVDGSGNTVVAGTLTLGDTGLIDLQDRTLIIHYSQDPFNPVPRDGPAEYVQAQLIKGRNAPATGGVFDGPWTGTSGITSTRAKNDFIAANAVMQNNQAEFFAVGYGDTGKKQQPDGSIVNKMLINDAPGFADASGNGIGSTVFVRYTRVGDATMDGIVGNNDVTVLGLNFDPTYDPTTNPNGPRHWYDGDFNYNGIVDNNDVTILGLRFDPTQPAAPFASLSSQFGSSFAAAFSTGYDLSHPSPAGVPPVPEPGALTLLGVGTLALIRRRRA